MKTINTLAGAAAFIFSAFAISPASAQDTQETPIPPCNEMILMSAIQQTYTAPAVAEQLTNIITAGQANTWQSAADVLGNHTARVANDNRFCSGQPNVSMQILTYAEVVDRPLPQTQVEPESQPVVAVETDTAEVEVEIAAAEAELNMVERQERTLEAQTAAEDPLERQQTLRPVQARASDLRQQIASLRSQLDKKASRAYVDQAVAAAEAEQNARFNPTSDSFYLDDEGMVEALLDAVTNPELGDGALVTKGDLNSAIASIEHPEAGTAPSVSDSDHWTWWQIALIALAVAAVVGLLVFWLARNGLAKKSDLNKYAQSADVTDDLKAKASGEEVTKLKSRVKAAEERIEDTRAQAGAKEVQIPEDTLSQVNQLKEKEETYLFLLVDEQPYKVRVQKGANDDELIILSGIKDQGSKKENAISRKNLIKVMRKAAFDDRLTNKDDGELEA